MLERSGSSAEPPAWASGESLLSTAGSERLRALEAQLAEIEAYKAENERDLRDALREASRLRQENREELQRMKNALRSEWERSIESDELSRPLELTYAFLESASRAGAQSDARWEGEIGQHIASLHRLKQEISTRAEERRRRAAYARDAAERLGEGPLAGQPASGLQSALDGVIASLDALMGLEERIQKLESVARDVRGFAEERRAALLARGAMGARAVSPSPSSSSLKRDSPSSEEASMKGGGGSPSGVEVHPVVRKWLERKDELERSRRRVGRRAAAGAASSGCAVAGSRQRRSDAEREMREFEGRREAAKAPGRDAPRAAAPASRGRPSAALRPAAPPSSSAGRAEAPLSVSGLGL